MEKVHFFMAFLLNCYDTWGRTHGDVYDFMRFYSISLKDFSLSMNSPFLDKRLTAD